MRRNLILTFIVLAAASSASAATRTVKVPPLLSHQVATLHGKGIGSILLPATMPTEAKHLYPSVIVAGKGYELDLGAAPGCDGANACFVAEFTASHRAPFGPTKVKLTHGITGYFKALTCGGSCSPPSIEFKRSGFTYGIQANVGTQKTEKSILVSMANSAIEHGAR